MQTIRPKVKCKLGVTVIVLQANYGSAEKYQLAVLENLLISVARVADPPLVVLDLSDTSVIGAAFVDLLLSFWRRLRERDGASLALAGLQPFCADVLVAARLDQVWEVFASPLDAVRALRYDVGIRVN